MRVRKRARRHGTKKGSACEPKRQRKQRNERGGGERIKREDAPHPVAFKGPFGVLSTGADALRWAVLSLANHSRYARGEGEGELDRARERRSKGPQQGTQLNSPGETVKTQRIGVTHLVARWCRASHLARVSSRHSPS